MVCASPGGVAVVCSSWTWVAGMPAPGTKPIGRLHAWPEDFFQVCDVADRCPEAALLLANVGELARSGRRREALEATLP